MLRRSDQPHSRYQRPNGTARIRRILGLGSAVCVGWLLLLSTTTHAQTRSPGDGSEGAGITVHGESQVIVQPNLLELDIHISGAAELSDDAMVKYRDAKKRVVEAYEELKIDDLEIVHEGVRLAAGNTNEMLQAMRRGQMPTNEKVPVEIASRCHIRLKDIGKLSSEELLRTTAKLIDVAKDSGANLGPSTADINTAYRYGRTVESAYVQFVLRDLDEVKEQAYRDAMADARNRAERIARLGDLKLGHVLSVQETFVSGNNPQTNVQPWQQSSSGTSVTKPQIVSDTFGDIPFRVKLVVRFAATPVADTSLTSTAPAK